MAQQSYIVEPRRNGGLGPMFLFVLAFALPIAYWFPKLDSIATGLIITGIVLQLSFSWHVLEEKEDEL